MIQFFFQSHHLVLPSPQINNTMAVRLGVKVKFAMDGTIWSYAQRPFARRFTMSFLITNTEKRHEVVNFLKITMGQSILMKDHNNLNWIGRIITTPFNPVDQARSNTTFTLEFESAPTG